MRTLRALCGGPGRTWSSVKTTILASYVFGPCNFYPWQGSYPEFEYVISWAVPKQCGCGGASPKNYPLVIHTLHQASLISQGLACSGAKFPTFPPLKPRIFGFSQEFPSSDAKISSVFPHFWPYSTKNLVCFTRFPFSAATFPTCAYKHTTMVPAESVKVYRYSDPKCCGFDGLLDVEIGVVGSDFCRFASFPPSSSEGPISVSRGRPI